MSWLTLSVCESMVGHMSNPTYDPVVFNLNTINQKKKLLVSGHITISDSIQCYMYINKITHKVPLLAKMHFTLLSFCGHALFNLKTEKKCTSHFVALQIVNVGNILFHGLFTPPFAKSLQTICIMHSSPTNGPSNMTLPSMSAGVSSPGWTSNRHNQRLFPSVSCLPLEQELVCWPQLWLTYQSVKTWQNDNIGDVFKKIIWDPCLSIHN